MQSRLSYLDTPSLLIDADKMERNLREMAETAADARVMLRPHVKTHKSPSLALRQIELGACGITVAKLGEAEIMADAGVQDIRIAYPIVGRQKLCRLSNLMDRAEISLSVDSFDVALGLSELGQAIGKTVRVLLKIDTGLHRVGVIGEEAPDVALRIASLPRIELIGILTHEGQALHEDSIEGAREVARRAGAMMVNTAEHLRQAGLNIREVSVGSTPTAREIAYIPGITEIRPGTYIFNDVNEMTVGVATEDTCALTVLATVVSIPSDNRAILDAGSKTLTSELLAAPSRRGGYGYIKGYPDVKIARLTEEHGILELRNAKARLQIGQQVEIIPNHVCPVVNMADVMYMVRDGVCTEQVEVLARGKNR